MSSGTFTTLLQKILFDFLIRLLQNSHFTFSEIPWLFALATASRLCLLVSQFSPSSASWQENWAWRYESLLDIRLDKRACQSCFVPLGERRCPEWFRLGLYCLPRSGDTVALEPAVGHPFFRHVVHPGSRLSVRHRRNHPFRCSRFCSQAQAPQDPNRGRAVRSRIHFGPAADHRGKSCLRLLYSMKYFTWHICFSGR